MLVTCSIALGQVTQDLNDLNQYACHQDKYFLNDKHPPCFAPSIDFLDVTVPLHSLALD